MKNGWYVFGKVFLQLGFVVIILSVYHWIHLVCLPTPFKVISHLMFVLIRRLGVRVPLSSLHWRRNDHYGVSNNQPHGCLLNRLFRRRSKKTSKLRVTGLCVGNSPGLVNSPHRGPVMRKMFPFDDVIMSKHFLSLKLWHFHNISNVNFTTEIYIYMIPKLDHHLTSTCPII